MAVQNLVVQLNRRGSHAEPLQLSEEQLDHVLPTRSGEGGIFSEEGLEVVQCTPCILPSAAGMETNFLRFLVILVRDPLPRYAHTWHATTFTEQKPSRCSVKCKDFRALVKT